MNWIGFLNENSLNIDCDLDHIANDDTGHMFLADFTLPKVGASVFVECLGPSPVDRAIGEIIHRAEILETGRQIEGAIAGPSIAGTKTAVGIPYDRAEKH